MKETKPIEIDADTLRPVYRERDWPEDNDHENGDYQCECCLCGHTFWGHKRRVVCKVCAVKGEKENIRYITEAELAEMEHNLRRGVRNACIIGLFLGLGGYFLFRWIIGLIS